MSPVLLGALSAAVGLSSAAARSADPPVPPPRPVTAARAAGEPDLQALCRSARDLIAQNAKDGRAVHLEKAWAAVTTVLASPADAPGPKAAALAAAIELVPRLRVELVRPWLERSLTQTPATGLSVLRAIGEAAGQEAGAPSRRVKLLKLQAAGVEALLTGSPGSAADHRAMLSAMSAAWAREANQAVAVTVQPRRSPGLPPAPPAPHSPSVFEVLDGAPGPRWLAAVDVGTRSRLLEVLTRVYLRADREDDAFACIEQQAAVNADRALQLAHEFLHAWTRSRNPNEGRSIPPQPPVVINGAVVNPRAMGIPLTRSRQERNLQELAGFAARIRRLSAAGPDEALLTQAFTSCHSSTEVFHRESLEAVFGPVTALKPQTLARLAQQMRTNLSGVWRRPDPQARQKGVPPPRRQEDLQAELLRGYETARVLLDAAQAQATADWQLALARAALMFDELDYRHEVEPAPDFARRRAAVMAEFSRAAGLYAAVVEDLAEEAHSDQVFETWFAAALGTSDLHRLAEDKPTDPRQAAAIRAALLALPGEAAERHVGRFAAGLVARLPMIRPAMKYRYLRLGAEVAAGHPRAGEARRLLEYYEDLTREVKLEAAVDGPTAVGSGQPFGVFVSLRHTKEIERESGGFGRYLQNQVGVAGSFNLGRPSANYRDRFQAAATAALEEHFEILSCTFETDKVVSRPAGEAGWRVTPYAYLLLKARGPQVDRLPPLQLDLDFLDTTGVVVLPVESPAVSVTAARRDPRPADRLEVTQTLDDRRGGRGELRLEVKATARGLVPDLDGVLALAPAGFEVVKLDSHPVSVSRFDPDAPKPAVVSERTWLVSLRAVPGAESQAFRFPPAVSPDVTVKFQRYQDADIVPAPEEVAVGGVARGWAWWWAAAAAGAVVAAAVLALLARRLWRRSAAGAVARRRAVPSPLTPFTAHGFLEGVSREQGLTPPQQAAVRQSMTLIEQYYFSKTGDGPTAAPDLKQLTGEWAATT